MDVTIIEEPTRIKRTPNGNKYMMRYSFNGRTYRAYGRDVSECKANCTMTCLAMQDELDRQAQHGKDVEEWMRANE